MQARRSWIDVDLDALRNNLIWLHEQLGPQVALLLVAKADAYGHGAPEVAQTALKCGVRAICVATTEEARQLREAGIRGRILVLGAFLEHEVRSAAELGVEVTSCSGENMLILEAAAKQCGASLGVHLKIDTGMHRSGAEPSEALGLLRWTQRSPSLVLRGLMTHIAATEGTRSPQARAQLECFERICRQARRARLLVGKDVLIHAKNSICALSGGPGTYDAVRIGIAAYGVSPIARESLPGALRPVLSAHATVVQVKEVHPGERVGYGGTWQARRPTRLALLPVGYDGGVDGRLSNRGSVLLGGRKAPIVGRVSMDYTTVDVTDVPDARTGSRATLIGRQGRREIRIEDWALAAETLPYALLGALGKGAPRFYRQHSDLTPDPHSAPTGSLAP